MIPSLTDTFPSIEDQECFLRLLKHPDTSIEGFPFEYAELAHKLRQIVDNGDMETLLMFCFKLQNTNLKHFEKKIEK